MPNNGPIIIVEDDNDDQEILKELFDELRLPNILRIFSSCIAAFNYLITTLEKPFLIICDINLPAMTGFDFKEKINGDDCLRRKNIPFVFLSTNSEKTTIAKAYDVLAQGYFVKPEKFRDIKDMLVKIVDYWKASSHCI